MNIYALPLKINTKNFDNNLFEEIDGKLYPTTYFKYISANFAKNFFKEKIKNLDKENLFFKMSEIIDVDPQLFEQTKINYLENNKDKIELANIEKNKWKESHKHYYRMQPSLPSSSIYQNIFYIDFDMTLNEAIQGYKNANEVLKSISNSELDKWCSELKPMLNYEYKDEYKKAMNEIDKKFGLMNDSELKETLPKTKVVKTRLSLNRQKCENHSILNKFINESLNSLN